MKKILLIALILALFPSCPVEYYEKLDGFFKRDTAPPVLLSMELSNNIDLSFRFNEQCLIKDLRAGDLFIPHNDYMTEHHLCTMFEAISPGEEKVLKMSVEDKAGNTSRFWTTLTGINLNVPDTLITEVSAAGTQTSPDRIEITFMSSGTTDGLCITDGALGQEKHRYYLPKIEVKRNDIAVIWWDREPRDTTTIVRDVNRTYILYAGSPETLSSTNGSVVLYSHTNGDGEVMDALLYNRSDATLADGFGNTRSRNTWLRMTSIEEWTEGTVHSDKITSSRVFSRYWPYDDTNTSNDWYTSAPRESTFGWYNNNREYVEE